MSFTSNKVVIGLGGIATVSLFTAATVLMPSQSNANPAFARATGHGCSYCHVPAQEPRLNETGREFRDCGYRFCGGSAGRPSRPFDSFGEGRRFDEGRRFGEGRTCTANFVCTFGPSPVCFFRVFPRTGGSRTFRIPAGESRRMVGFHPGETYCRSTQGYPGTFCDRTNIRMNCD